MANTAIPKSSTSEAATSSCVERGLDAQSTKSAPPAESVRARFAVSAVTWRQAERRIPASGLSFSKRSRIWASTGIDLSAHSMRDLPLAASSADRIWADSCVAIVSILSTRAESLIQIDIPDRFGVVALRFLEELLELAPKDIFLGLFGLDRGLEFGFPLLGLRFQVPHRGIEVFEGLRVLRRGGIDDGFQFRVDLQPRLAMRTKGLEICHDLIL